MIPLKRANAVLFTIGLAICDAAAILVAYVGAISYTQPPGMAFDDLFVSHMFYLVIFVAVWWGAAVDDRLWGSRRSETLSGYLSIVTKAVGDALVFSVFVMALFTERGIERDFLVAFSLGTLAVMLVYRSCVRVILWQLRAHQFNLQRILVVGANDRSVRLVETIRANPQYGYFVVGFIEDDTSRLHLLRDLDVPHLGGSADLDAVFQAREIAEVYICLPMRSLYETAQRIAEWCEARAITVRIIADLFPVRIATSRLIHVDDIPFLSLSTIPEEQFKLAMKRAVDFLVSSMLLIFLSPFFFLMALIIKLDSKGPVFFLQERVGQNQRRFQMIKFRSMVVNAEELRQRLEAQNEADGPVFKIRQDPRITRVGRFIRKYSLDEFPQLINVWMGEMSLVGPRPPIPKEVAEYSWDQRRRLSVKPGMTGLWQVSGRSDTSFTEWVELDLQYIDNWTLFSDFIILLKTFRAVVSGRGAA